MRKLERPFFISPREFVIVAGKDGNVWMRIAKPDPSLGLRPDLAFSAILSPTEARDLATRLGRMADEAEAKRPPKP